tara:strand:+ start:310 stop:1302 length:993 start_codon:yes stop_codon:yes gene_type:complete
MNSKKTFIKSNNKKLLIEIEKLEKYFLNLVDEFKINSIWSEKNFFEIEMTKSFIRGLLRESDLSYKILIEMVENFKLSDNYSSNIKWCTKLYPMIHLPGDKSEAVGLHYDNFGKNEFYTSWTALTNYKYPALSYLNHSEKLNKFFSKIILKTKISNFILKKINVNKGEIFIWNGNMIHCGNLNKSNSISAAFQMKFTDKKFKHEESLSIENKIIKKSHKVDNEILKKNYTKIIDFILNLKLSFEENKNLTINFLKDNSIEKNKILSFSLSLLAQRISTNNFQIPTQIERAKIINNLDLFSLFLGAENLSSLSRLKNKYKNISLEEILNYH